MKQKVLVVGAGFSGLTAAHYLERAGYEVEIHEAKPAPGGLLGTKITDFGLVETAANGLLNTELVEDLFNAVHCEMIPTEKQALARYIYRDGEPKRWPLSFAETLRVVWFVLRFIFAKQKVLPRPFETIEQWGSRVFSKTVSRYTIETLLQGIYAGDPKKMSTNLILGVMLGGYKKKRSRPLRFRGTVSARGGMGELIAKVTSSLKERGVNIHFDSALNAGQIQNSEHPVVIATSAKAAAQLLEKVDPARAELVRKIELLPIITATVAFPLQSNKYQGFGVLFPLGSAKMLGVLMNNFIFAGRAQGVLSETWIFGGSEYSGSRENELIGQSDQEILDTIHSERTRVFGLTDQAQAYVITRWPQALPHFTTELEKHVLQIRENRGNVFLLGNYTGGIGLSKILEQASQLPNLLAQKRG